MTGRRAAVALALAGLGVAGCGKTIKSGDLEQKIADSLQQQVGERPKIDCPGGEKAKKGRSFDCTLTARDRTTTTVRVTLTDDNGRFTYQVLPPSRK